MITPNLTAGSFRTVITPAIGCNLQGSLGDVRSDGILDDLFANALVISDGERQAAIISVDVCEVPGSIYQAVALEIEQTWDIPRENVILAATHTHHGPFVEGCEFDVDHQQAYYPDFFRKQVVSAVGMAQKRRQPVTVAAGKAENSDYLFNRRMRKPDGRILMNWIDPAYLEDTTPSGPVDPELVVVKFQDEQGVPVAFILNYANHNNAAPGDGISADISGYLGNLLRRLYGPDLGVVFLLGACGNVNWLDHHDPERWSAEHYQRIATGLAGTVLQVESVMKPIPVSKIEVTRTEIAILERPYRDFDTQVDDTFGGQADFFFSLYKQARQEAEGKPLPVHAVGMTALKLGEEITICTSPNELFCDIGLALKAGSPYRYTMISELTNGYLGYVPTRQAFAEGGYEIRKLPGNSFLAFDAAEMIVAAGLELLKGQSA